MMKLLSGLFSYWQTRDSSSGASFKRGKAEGDIVPDGLSPSALIVLSPEVGSKSGPRVSSATLKPLPWFPGMP